MSKTMEYFMLAQKGANCARCVRAIPDFRKYIGQSMLISHFPHIKEFGRQKYDTIVDRSLGPHRNDGFEICYVYKGKYEWEVEGHKYLLLPGDTFITCPWETHGSPQEHLDLGVIAWIVIKPRKFGITTPLDLGSWCSLSALEQHAIGQAMKRRTRHCFNYPLIGGIFSELYTEIVETKPCFTTRVNRLIEDLFILSLRHFENRESRPTQGSGFLIRLSEKILSRLYYPLSVSEMASFCGMGTTTFNLRLKELTGFTPGEYLIQLRLDEARRMLTGTDKNITAIALDCGFFSPGHFSDAFRKRTGMLPKDYRRMQKKSG